MGLSNIPTRAGLLNRSDGAKLVAHFDLHQKRIRKRSAWSIGAAALMVQAPHLQSILRDGLTRHLDLDPWL
jgi:hypothetical protein